MSAFSPDPAEPLRFLTACPVHAPTPVLEIPDRSGSTVLVKNETARMGLGAFKALGGVYAVAKLICEKWEQENGCQLDPSELTDSDTQSFAHNMTFVCASAGNHGMAVAAGARIFGARARIYLSEQVPEGFATRLREKSADVVRTGETYEESMAAAQADAESTGAVLLADSSWPGYIHPPWLVMEGYTVIAEELREHFEDNGEWPSHVYLQAGVGGLAGAITHMIRENWAVQPEIVIVEPDAAPCLRASHEAGDPVEVEGPVSNMGRLDCKEPSLIAHGIFKRTNVVFAEVSDELAQSAADYLGEQGLPTTPSGAAGLAAYWQSGLADSGASHRPLILVTEGAV